MFKSTNYLAFILLLVALSGCGTEKKAAINQQKSLASLSQIELRIGGTPHKIDSTKEGYYNVGTPATPEEIAGWDIDIRPDGTGLPPGSGSAADGEDMYQAKCASCHGVFGEGSGRWPKLAGGFGTLSSDRPDKTVGSYWPYASTLWDYIHRAMPFTQPQSLSNDEVYALTAYVLYMNDIIDEDLTLNAQNLASVEMPNKDGFFIDTRPDSTNTLCMSNCRDPDSIKVTWDASDLGVTPVSHMNQGDEGDEGNEDVQIKSGKAVNQEGLRVYNTACGVCHNSGVAGAPTLLDNSADWQKRASQGTEVVIRHAIEGYSGDKGMMPAKGGQMHLSDEEVKAAVMHMLTTAGVERAN
jgi:cytochrome c5